MHTVAWDSEGWHEGRLVGIAANGEIIEAFEEIEPELDGTKTFRPADISGEAIGWCTACACGWTSRPWKRVLDPSEASIDTHTSCSDDYGHPEAAEALEALEEEWTAHAYVEVLPLSIKRHTKEIERATTARDIAVQEARKKGISWDKIGKAAGMTRQSAQGRWGRAKAAEWFGV